MKKIKNVITMDSLRMSMTMDYLVFNKDLKSMQNTKSHVEGMYFNYKSEKIHIMYCINETSYFIFEDTKKDVTYVLNFDKDYKLTFRKSNSSLDFTKNDLMFICSCWEFIRSQTRVNNYKKLDKMIHANIDYKYYRSIFSNYKKSTYRIFSNSH